MLCAVLGTSKRVSEHAGCRLVSVAVEPYQHFENSLYVAPKNNDTRVVGNFQSSNDSNGSGDAFCNNGIQYDTVLGDDAKITEDKAARDLIMSNYKSFDFNTNSSKTCYRAVSSFLNIHGVTDKDELKTGTPLQTLGWSTSFDLSARDPVHAPTWYIDPTFKNLPVPSFEALDETTRTAILTGNSSAVNPCAGITQDADGVWELHNLQELSILRYFLNDLEGNRNQKFKFTTAADASLDVESFINGLDETSAAKKFGWIPVGVGGTQFNVSAEKCSSERLAAVDEQGDCF
jgi:hypothetical protein